MIVLLIESIRTFQLLYSLEKYIGILQKKKFEYPKKIIFWSLFVMVQSHCSY